jgi:UDP-N-acetylmuramoyl-tripeptide--D-alanyl-D-alanine ligase
MAELGQQSEQLHQELGEEIAQADVDVVVSVGRLASTAGEQAKLLVEADGRSIRTESFESAGQACDKLDDLINNYDIILVKGSRLAGLEQVVEKLKEQFSQCTTG